MKTMKLVIEDQLKKRFIGLKKVLSWLYLYCNQLYLDPQKYFDGVDKIFGSIFKGAILVLEVLPEIEEILIGSIKVGSWLLNAYKAPLWLQELTVNP